MKPKKPEKKEVYSSKCLEVCEIFSSICGEGIETFEPAIFIRTARCNMKCAYPCDTIYSWSKGKSMQIKDIVDEVHKHTPKTVFLTGGEFLIWKVAGYKLVKQLYKENYRIILQTNGSKYHEGIFELCDEISLDYKGPSAGKNNVSNRNIIENTIKKFSRYIQVQIKFLVKNEADYKFAKKRIKELERVKDNRAYYVVGPVGGLKIKELVKKVLEDRTFPMSKRLRIGGQVHNMIWGSRTRGV